MSHIEVRTRFAPSPTGYLHVGGARTALFNWLYARHCEGQFVLRIEDTDRDRHVADGLDAILTGLRWLGLDWDEGPEAGGDRGPYFQSERLHLYDAHLETLRRKGLVYTEANGAVRFKSPRKPVTIHDQICGAVHFKRDEPDMTIRRPDGSYIFHFVNVVDDLEMAITHVIRGEDHLSNTPKHIELFQALDASPPVYAHIPLILNPDGTKMSKRDRGAALGEYRVRAFLPAAVTNYLALLSWSAKTDEEKLSLDEMIRRFDFPGINKGNASFDVQKLIWLNSRYLMELDDEAFFQHCLPVLAASGIPTDDEATLRKILSLMQKKVSLASEIPTKITFFFTDAVEPEAEAVAQLAKDSSMAERLETIAVHLKRIEAWTEEAINSALEAAAEALGVKKGKLMFPARVAASGSTTGPDLLPMLEILGQDRVLARFAKTVSTLRTHG